MRRAADFLASENERWEMERREVGGGKGFDAVDMGTMKGQS